MKTNVGAVNRAHLVAPAGELPPLSVGETVSVKIAGFKNGKYEILLNGERLEAESKIALPVGERLTVRVTALEPRVILTPVGSPDVNREFLTAIGVFWRLFRQEPSLFKDVLAQGHEMFTREGGERLRGAIDESMASALAHKLAAVLNKGTEVKELASTLGLFHERDLANGVKPPESLKSLLLQLADELKETAGGRSKEVEALSRWVSATLNRIETCQVVNVLSRDREGLFFLPLPFLLGGEPRVGEFYARVEEKEAQKGCRAWVFLDLPALGRVMVEMHLTGDRLSVFVRCEQVESKDYLLKRAGQLKERLGEEGYRSLTLGFGVERDLDNVRRDLWQGIPAFHEGTLQVRV